MDILPAWLIEDLEKLRKEQERKRPELHIQLPLREEIRLDPEKKEDEDVIIIPLR